MKLNQNGLIVAGTYALLLWLTLETLSGTGRRSVSTAAVAERTAFWAVILLVTAATITRMIRRRRLEPLGLDAALREMEHWAEGIVQGWRRLRR